MTTRSTPPPTHTLPLFTIQGSPYPPYERSCFGTDQAFTCHIPAHKHQIVFKILRRIEAMKGTHSSHLLHLQTSPSKSNSQLLFIISLYGPQVTFAEKEVLGASLSLPSTTSQTNLIWILQPHNQPASTWTKEIEEGLHYPS